MRFIHEHIIPMDNWVLFSRGLLKHYPSKGWRIWEIYPPAPILHWLRAASCSCNSPVFTHLSKWGPSWKQKVQVLAQKEAICIWWWPTDAEAPQHLLQGSLFGTQLISNLGKLPQTHWGRVRVFLLCLSVLLSAFHPVLFPCLPPWSWLISSLKVVMEFRAY